MMTLLELADRFLHELDLVAPNMRASHDNTVFTRSEIMQAFNRFAARAEATGQPEARG